MSPAELRAAWEANRAEEATAEAALASAEAELALLAERERNLVAERAAVAAELGARSVALADLEAQTRALVAVNRELAQLQKRAKGLEQASLSLRELAARTTHGRPDPGLVEQHLAASAELGLPLLDVSAAEVRSAFARVTASREPDALDFVRALTGSASLVLALGEQANARSLTARASFDRLTAWLQGKPSLVELEDKVATLRARLAAIDVELANVRAARADALERIAALRVQLHALGLEPPLRAGLFASVSPDVPLALFPVRLETRFFPGKAADRYELRVRIYPDRIHEDKLSRRLTASERASGEHYWQAIWAAGTGPAARPQRETAWSELVRQVGARRAAWIARVLRPDNPRSDPAPVFPAPDVRTVAELPPAHAAVLPDRWVVTAYRAGRRVFAAWGAPVVSPLAVSVSPAANATSAGAGALDAWLDDGVRWMVDFDRAEQAGMAVRVDVPRATADAGFDVLLALGVRGTADATTSGNELGALLEAHRYASGLGFARQGTPTNHGETERVPAVDEAGLLAGFREEDAPVALDPETPPDPASNPQTFANGSVTARAFGLLPARPDQPTVFEGVLDAELREQLWAHDMNVVTWPATWGYFLDQMFGNTLVPWLADARSVPPEQALLDFRSTLDAWRGTFARSVRARGPLPVLRVGSQPYGLLPVTSLERFRAVKPEAPGLCVYETDGVSLRAHRASANPDVLAWSTLAATPAGAVSSVACVTATDLEADGRRDLVLACGGGRAPLGVMVAPLADPALDDPFAPAGPSALPFSASAVRAIAAVDLARSGAAVEVVLVVQTTAGAALVLGQGLDRSATVRRWRGPFALPAPSRASRELGLGLALADLDGVVTRPVPFPRPGLPGLPGLPGRPRVPDTRFDARPHVVLARTIVDGGRNWLELTTGAVFEPSGLTGGWSTTRVDVGALRPEFAHAPNLDVAVTLEGRGGYFDLWVALSDRQTLSVYRLAHLRSNATFDGSPALVIDRRTASGFRLVGLALEVGRRVARPALAPDLDAFADLLASLRAQFRPCLDAVPSLERGRRDGDPDRAVLEALALDAVSFDFRTRTALGPKVATDLAWYQADFPAGFQPPASWTQERAALRAWLQTELGLPSKPWDPTAPPGAAITQFSFADPAPVTLPSLAPGMKNVFAWAAGARPAELHALTSAPEDSVLARLLAQTLGWAYAGVAFDAYPPNRSHLAPNFELSRDPELVDVLGSANDDGVTSLGKTLTPWRHLAGTEPNATVTRGDELAALAKNGAAPAPLQASVDALVRLARESAAFGSSPEDTLGGALLLGESLDLASHRLDAWITALATERLASLRTTTPAGITLGGYGWVVGLKPRGTTKVSEGYLHAPSAAHAAAAAVLRSGQLSHAGSTGQNALSSIDLSSARTRLALEILDGVRQGQALGALLGYRFERGLREASLPALIPAFRELAPQKGGQALDGEDRALPIAGAVVDGLRLSELADGSGGTIPWGDATLGLPDAATDAAARIQGLLAAVADALDAVKDLCLAEGVYQMVRGLPQRAAAAMDALARGDSMPEFEFPATPRTGTSLTHRLLALTSPSAPLPGGFSGARGRPRAVVEPALDAWVAGVLGEPARVACRVLYTNGATGAVTPVEVRLDALGLCALDYLCFPPFDSASRDSELERRILDAAEQSQAPDAEQRETLSVDFEAPSGAIAVADFMTLVGAVGELIGRSRPLNAADLDADATLAGTGSDVAERLGAARARLEQAAATLEDPASDMDALRAALADAAGFGVSGAFVRAAASLDAVSAQALAVAVEIEHRLVQARPSLEPNLMLRALFGGGFPILPELTLATSQSALLLAALDARLALGDAPPSRITAWLRGVARVRETPARFETVALYAEALNAAAPASLELAVLQLPLGDGSSPWVGLPTASPAQDWPRNPRSLVVCGALDALEAQGPSVVSGLLFDEWTELSPGTREVTSFLFHYDAPAAAPPQSVLLAVPPVPGEPWDLATLEAVVLGTLELAKLRTVTLDDLAGSPLARVLPAIYLAQNAANETLTANLES